MSRRPRVPGLSARWSQHQLDLLELAPMVPKREDETPRPECCREFTCNDHRGRA